MPTGDRNNGWRLVVDVEYAYGINTSNWQAAEMKHGAAIMVLAVTAAACASTSDSAPPLTRDVVRCDPPAVESALSGRAVEQVASTPREDVPSALVDPLAADLPTPSIDVDRLIAAFPKADGIPPVDEPRFLTTADTTFLADCELVIAVEQNGDARAYPIQILLFHEIVNDTVGGVPVTVTYCPLCNSAVVFDRRLDQRVLDFGTSGSLYNSALVMYDRQTESLWTHFTGEAIAGTLTGQQLSFLPTATVTWGDWKVANPDGLVLSRDTGATRPFGTNPYDFYDRVNSPARFFDGQAPGEFKEKERFIGILHKEVPLAIRLESAFHARVTDVELAGDRITVWVKPGAASPLERLTTTEALDIGSTGVFVAELDGEILAFTFDEEEFRDEQTGSYWNILGEATSGPLQGRRLVPVDHIDTFWFAWTAFHPDTQVLE